MTQDKDGNWYWTSHFDDAEKGEHWVDLKDLVTINIAKMLKKLGFDRKSKGAILYEDGSWLIENASDNLDWNHMWGPMYNSDVNCMTIPTWDIALQWLKEVYNITIEVRYQDYLQEYYCCITYGDKTYGLISDYNNSSYRITLEAGLKKCLTDILNKTK